jgi:hypothetical protein
MLRSTTSKVMWVGRATVFLVGLAVILALVAGVASTAFAGNGDAWRLGRSNVATAITALGGTLGADGPMLRLTNNNAGTNDTALDLKVQPGEAPMSVNSGAKVNSLNADQLDGLDSTFFARNAFYKTEGVINEGLLLGEGTHKAIAFCEPGDVLLSGGPANIDKETTLLESFPSPGTVGSGTQHSWTVRVDKHGFVDNFNVVVLCIDQFNP